MITRHMPDLGALNYIPAEAMADLGFSSVVVSDGLVFVSGVAPIQGPEFAIVGESDLGAQCAYVLDVLAKSLESVGSSPKSIVDLTVYLTGTTEIGSKYTEIAPQLARFVGNDRPTATAVGVTSLFLPAQQIEVRAVARVSR
ncbi:RidA family protein [Gordonia desulfuricans]|uniref:RidA family protein n=2 Tax=Gordoniaceae TaxID=85026 RepID=A0A7K3LQL8_9ACTN|nr:RidA family protein [Gordonia desulfuricans]KOY49438.1 hypothetical protein ISGA_10200 [Gordonia sp. NB41Y]NDK90552.1 RidA family protein [Gordonia desulfuricans]